MQSPQTRVTDEETALRATAGRPHPRADDWLTRPPSEFFGEERRPLFIGGSPRSGTTLLRTLLNNHPDLAIPPETNVVIPTWRKRARYGDLGREESRRRLAEWIFDSPQLGGNRLRRARFFTREDAIARVMAAPPTLGSVFAAVFGMFAEAKGKQRWGDKRPRYAGMIDMIFALFPNAQFVNLVRDPRASVASQIPLGWDDDHTALASAICTWEWSVRRVDRFAPRLRPDQLLDIRFEDLVREPNEVLTRICRFASLEDAPGTVEDMIAAPRVGVHREGWHERLSEPITTQPIGAWTARLGGPEVALIEQELSSQLERFAYLPVQGVDARPLPSDLKKLRAQRYRRRKKWLRYDVGEMKRKHLTYRYPVAAQT